MKSISLLLIAVLVNCVTAQCPDTFDPQSLQLTAEVVRTKRISADDELYVDNIVLRLRFKNRGFSPAVIYRRNLGVSHIWISESDKKQLEKAYEVSTAYTLVHGTLPDDVGINDFIILKKGQEFRADIQIPVLVRKILNVRIPGSVSQGPHSVRIQVQTWYADELETDFFKKKFRKYGLLLADPVVSESFAITTE